MKSFLQECAEDILNKFDKEDSICVVFPNKRTMIYFRKEYAKLKNEVSFAKNLYPINLILNKFHKTTTADELTLLFELYDAFRQVFFKPEMRNKNIAGDFNLFFDTGQKILSDFNEIDNYLIDIDRLCHNFADLSELDAFYSDLDEETVKIIKAFWANFSTERLSNEKLRFQELWINLPKVYKIFRENLKAKKCSYSGMHNREICEIIKNGNLKTEFKTYIFVGFNVLNKAERKIFSYLKQSGKAKFYWDADNYYISDKNQEAGMFMRGYLKDFPNEINSKPPSNIISQEKNVEYIAVPLEVAQAKAVHDVLSEMSKMPDFVPEKTAVVLGDEHLLFPVLNSIPKEIEKINVTMGYPFKETPVFSFIDNCLQLRNNVRKTSSGNTDYYFKDVMSVLNHPFVCNLKDFYSKAICQKIKDERKIRIPKDFLGSYSHILSLIFETEISSPEDLLNNFLEILSEIYFIKNPESENSTPKLENEFIYSAYTSIKKLYNNISALKYKELDLILTTRLLKQHLLEVKIPFESEDGDGIQIIGMMETRNIDFDNIILTGMNEGVFPKRSENNSFITEGMRLAFDMPVVKFKDAVFGYFFYRLFQRSKNITVLYNNVFANSLSGEASRFATQILKEASSEAIQDSKIHITQKQFVRKIQPLKAKDIFVKSNEDTFEKLRPYFSKGEGARALSPSALNTFINCPLKFYFQYIARLLPKEDLEEEATAADFGSILHSTIEKLYNKICELTHSKTITCESIKLIHPLKEEFALEQFNQHFKVNNSSKEKLSGFDSIFFEVLLQYLDRILDFDSSIAPFQLTGTEKKEYARMKIFSSGKALEINLGGILDREDFIEKTQSLRIVDYKTGDTSDSMKFSCVDDIFSKPPATRSKEAFQVLLYSWVYMQNHPNTQPEPAIYSVRNEITKENSRFTIIKDKKITIPVNKNNIKELTEEFKEKLKAVLEQLFDINQEFKAKESPNCRYCNFQNFCQGI